MAEAVSGQQTILPTNSADEASHAAIAIAYGVDGGSKDCSDHGLDLRKPRQHDSVTAKQCNRAALTKRNGSEKLLEVGQLDGPQYEAQKLAIRSLDPPDEKHRPCAIGAVMPRLTYVRRHPRIGLNRLEEISIGDADIGTRPKAREIDETAIGIYEG